MKKQKIVSLLLVAALMVPLCTTAFAAAGDTVNPEFATPTETDLSATTSTEVTIGSLVYLPVIKVTIQEGVSIIANPYQMPWTPAAGGTPDNSSVISVARAIKSNSTLKIDVTAKPTVTPGSTTLQIFAEPIPDDVKKAGTKAISLDYNTAVITAVGTAGKTAAEGWDGTSTSTDITTGTFKTVPVKESEANVAKIQLPKADDDTDAKAVYGAFKITGECSGNGWSNADAVTVNIVYDIAPVIGS